MHFCGRHTGRQVIYCIFFCQVCQYIKVQHSKIDFTFWRRHNNIFHESRSETKSGKMEQQMQLCSSRVDSGSVPSYLVIRVLQDRSDLASNCWRKKATIFGRRRQFKTIEREKICLARRKVESVRLGCTLVDWFVQKKRKVTVAATLCQWTRYYTNKTTTTHENTNTDKTQKQIQIQLKL